MILRSVTSVSSGMRGSGISRDRLVWILGWASIALLFAALGLVFWITKLADGPPYTTCGNSTFGQQFAVLGIGAIGVAFAVSLVTALGSSRVEFWRRIPAILVSALALPLAIVYVLSLMFAFGWEC